MKMKRVIISILAITTTCIGGASFSISLKTSVYDHPIIYIFSVIIGGLIIYPSMEHWINTYKDLLK